MIKKGKQVFVFFSDKPIRRSERNEKEEKKVEAFKRKYRNRGVYVEYGSDEEFSEIITRNLKDILRQSWLTKRTVLMSIPDLTVLSCLKRKSICFTITLNFVR